MILLNNYILVREVVAKDEQLSSGLILPEQEQQEDQVAQGKVLQVPQILIKGSGFMESDGRTISDTQVQVLSLKKDDIILFHKMIPVDAQLKMENGDIERVWFIKEEDIICVL